MDEDESIEDEDERVRKGREGVEGEGEAHGEGSRKAKRRPERYHCCVKIDAREYSGIEYCGRVLTRQDLPRHTEGTLELTLVMTM